MQPDQVEPGGAPEAVYQYRDENGVLLAEKRRYAGKRFVWCRPDGQGGWLLGRGDLPVGLYRLPDIRQRGATELCVVEGEKDADRLWSLGLPATTAPDGSQSWKPDYAQQIKAAAVNTVLVIPDNDDAGRNYGAGVAASCHAAGLRTKIVALPGLPEHGDVSDYLDVYDAQDLMMLALQAPDWLPSTGLRVARLDTIAPEAVSWLWEGRLARGKATVLAGDPGVGKSYLTDDIAARPSRGMPWPDAGTAPLGRVLILSAEDGPADTIRPRLDALGADPTRIAVLEAVVEDEHERVFSLDRDVPRLAAELRQQHFDLVIIDPVTAYLGQTDSHKDADVRRVMAPLFKVLEQRHTALLMVAHLNKNLASASLYRVSGSIGIVAAARIGLVLGIDPEDETRRVLAYLKCNLSAPPASLAYRIEPSEGGLVWEAAPVNLDAADVLQGPRPSGSDSADGEDWLRSALEDGPVDAKTIFSTGHKEGYSHNSINAAKKRLGIRSKKAGFQADARWIWQLPLGGATHEGTDRTFEDLQ